MTLSRRPVCALRLARNLLPCELLQLLYAEPEETAEMVAILGLPHLCEILRAHEICGSMLFTLGDDEVAEMFPSPSDQIIFTALIQTLQDSAFTCASETSEMASELRLAIEEHSELFLQDPVSRDDYSKNETSNSTNLKNPQVTLSSSLSETMKLQPPKKNLIRVTNNQNITKMIDISTVEKAPYASIIEHVAQKFSIHDEDLKQYAFFVNDENGTHSLKESEAVLIMQDTDREERNNLFFRKLYVPAPDAARNLEYPSKANFAKQRNTLFAASNKRASFVNRKLPLMATRPPSEVISAHLFEYFPKEGVFELERRISRASIMGKPSRISAMYSESESAFQKEMRPDGRLEVIQEVPMGSQLSPLNELLNRATENEILAQRRMSPVGQSPKAGDRTTIHDEALSENQSPFKEQAENQDEVDGTSNIVTEIEGQDEDENSLESEVSESPLDEIFDESERIAGDAPDQWLRGALIGRGSFGAVYLGLDPRMGSYMAVKMIELPPDDDPRRHTIVDSMYREISVLREIQHPNIVQYLGASLDAKMLSIFLEYVPGHSIAWGLSHFGRLPEQVCARYLSQTLNALNFLHENGIIHRDIKGANILTDSYGNIKLADFGISQKIEQRPGEQPSIAGGTDSNIGTSNGRTSPMPFLTSSAPSSNAGPQGSVYWMAPEVVRSKLYTFQGDVWSIGCLLVEMLTAEHPFPGASLLEAFYKIGHGTVPELPDDISSEAKDFCAVTLRVVHTDRPQVSELIGHPFVAQVEQNAAASSATSIAELAMATSEAS